MDTTNLEGAILTWWRNEDGTFDAKKTITIPPVPADPDDLPELLKGFAAVPPLVTDIDLSLDDKYLYVACWGTGEMHQYDVSDPMNPVLNGKVEIGGRGGTMVSPAFRYVEENELNVDNMVVFTDLGINDFPEEPHYPVLWISSWANANPAPFGQTTYLDA